MTLAINPATTSRKVSPLPLGEAAFSATDVRTAMASCRSTGAVGKNAIVPRIVADIATPKHTILDFGAGKDEIHADNLRNGGFQVASYDFHLIGHELALQLQYSIVYASNVLNVQTNVDMLQKTLFQCAECMEKDGVFICNYPASPRKAGLSVEAMERQLGRKFNSVERIGKDKAANNIVWVCKEYKYAI